MGFRRAPKTLMASGLTTEYVLDLIESGMSQAEIAAQHGVSRQYVNKLARQGGYVSAMVVLNDHMPWEVPGEYQANTLYQAMRILGHYNLDGIEGVSEGESRRKLKTLLRKLHVFNQVIDFDPSYPAIPGVVNTMGFAYVPRTPEDGDFAIKIRPGVRITELGEKLWRLPPMI